MDTHSTNWLRFKSGSEVRGPEALLTDRRVEKIGYAFACFLARRCGTTPDTLTIAVGCDGRPSGRRIRSALIRGVTAADSDVLDAGLCAEPALFAAECQGAVMVTASQSEADVNGFKFSAASGGLTGEDVGEILALAAATEVPERLVVAKDLMQPYLERLRHAAAVHLEDDALKPLLGMYVIVDARTGAGDFFIPFLEELGVDTEGSLLPEAGPAPDPSQAVAELGRLVRENRADLGVLFDAGCARAAIVDQDGQPLASNRMIALLAAMLLEKHPGATFVTDSVTSSGLSAFIAEWGGVHYRFKRGYRNVIDEAVRLNAEGIDCPLAIETSGHAAFRENGFLDDGPYLALRIICEAMDRKREGQTLTALIDDLQQPVESVEIRLPVLDREDPAAACQEIVETLLSHTLEDPEWQMAPDSREGVRITFNLDGGVNNAWFQLRMSVHDPVMALNAQSDVPGGVERILGQLYALIRDTELLDLTPLRATLDDAL